MTVEDNKRIQYEDYLYCGGTMPFEEWENDGRFDPSYDPTTKPAPDAIW